MKPAALSLALALAALPTSAFAHKFWLLPSQTVLAGETPAVTVDAAVSNDLFYFNHVPLRLDGLRITAPDGSAARTEHQATGRYRSVFDLALAQQGTYRLAVLNDGVVARWNENGQPKRWRGKAAELATQVPAEAKDLQVTQSSSRVETFVTNGSPNATALQANGKGLEMILLTHPNDLFAQEPAKFELHVDGKPVAKVNVEIVRGGTRYRNGQEEIKIQTDANGQFTVTWPQPGMYWLEASTEDDKTSIPGAQRRRLIYVATLEVLPQ